MPEPASAAEVARALADVLERAQLSYAIGGAIALGFYAPPRATIDVDVNVFVSPARDLDRALNALRSSGFVPTVDAAALRRSAQEEGQFRGTISGLRVDVFVPAIDYYAEMESRRRQVTLLGRPLWILSAEDLVVLKLMFFRRKDLADVEAVMRERGPLLDRAFVRDKLTALAGPGNERLAALEAIEHDVDSA